MEQPEGPLIDTHVPESYRRPSAPLIEAVHPWQPFSHSADLAPHVLARTVVTDKDPAAALKVLLDRQAGKYRTPVPEWLHQVIRPLFAEQFLDGGDFSNAFDRTEVVLGLLSQDQDALTAAQHPDRAWQRGSMWFGRSTWRAAEGGGNAVAEIQGEKSRQGTGWALLQAGLFGGDPDRADQAMARYAEAFNDRSWSRP